MRSILIIAILVLANLPVSTFGQEPTWGKLPLSTWKKQLQDPSAEARSAAALEFYFMDYTLMQQAVPELREATKNQDFDFRNCVFRALWRGNNNIARSVPSLIALLEAEGGDAKNTSTREKVVESLGNIGLEKIDEVIPLLVRQFGVNADLDDATAVTLCRLGPAGKPALPALKKLIRADTPPDVLSHAAMSIAGLEPEAPEVKQAIVLLTPMERSGKIRPGPPVLKQEFVVRFPELVVTHVVPLLEDQDKMVRYGAARILAAAGPKAREHATAPLKKALQDAEPEVRLAAVRGLHAVAPEEFGPAIPVLIPFLGPELSSSEAAMMLRPRPGDSFTLLIRELDNKESNSQSSLIETLSYLRYDNIQCEPRLDAKTIAEQDRLLIAALADPSLRIRRGTANVVRRLGPQASAAVPALLQLTKDADGEARLDAIGALVEVDPRHHTWQSWLPALEVIALEKNHTAQYRSIVQIRSLGSAAKSAAPTLVKAAEVNEGSTRVQAAITLVIVDPSQKAKVLPALLEEIKAERFSWHNEIAEALAEFGPAAKEALPALQAALASKERFPEQKVQIIKALTRIDSGQIPVCRSVVQQMFKHPRYGWRPRWDVLKLLPEWGGEARPLAPLLREIATQGKVNAELEAAAAVSLVLVGDDDGAGLNVIHNIINTPAEGLKRGHLLHMADQLGPLARPLVPELRPLIADAALGEFTKEVLAKIDPQAE